MTDKSMPKSIPPGELDDAYSYMRRLAISWGISQDLVDELVQETFLQFYMNPDLRPPHVPIKAWLAGILRNVIRNMFRNEARLPTTSIEPMLMARGTPVPPEPLALTEHMIAALRDHPERSYLVDALVDLGFDSDELAELLGVTPKQVPTRVRSRGTLSRPANEAA